MFLIDLVDEWAKSKGWWTFKVTPSEDGYLYIAKHNPWPDYDQAVETFIKDGVPIKTRRPIFTLWANAAWDMDGHYPDRDDQKLEPADPDFFLNLEYLIITKT